MSAIEISCPHCGAKTLVSPDDLGHDIDCPKCEESFEAPRMAKRSRVVGKGQSEDAQPEDGDFDEWIAALRNKYGDDENQKGFSLEDWLVLTLEDRVKSLSEYLGGDDAVKSATDLLQSYIRESEGEVPGGRDLLESALTLKDDPDFYVITSVDDSIPKKPQGTVHLLWRGREVVKVDFECEYVDHPERHLQTPESRTDPDDELAWLPISDPRAYSEEAYTPDLWFPDRRVRKNGRATLIADANSKRPVEGLEDILRRQKASGPKKDQWADFEEPTHGQKMSCWRCGYHGRAPEQRRSAGDAVLGFRAPVCPRCKAVNSRPLPVLTRILYTLGSLLFLLMSGFALFNAFHHLQRDSTGAMTLGGLVAAAFPVTLLIVCVKALAKDSSIRSAKKK